MSGARRRPDDAIEAVERPIRMSRRDPFNYAYLHFAAIACIAYLVVGRYAEGVACEELRRAGLPEG